MSVTHIAPSISSATFFRALAIASTSKLCPHTARTFSAQAERRASSKRELYTTPAYRPHTMPEFPMPPRNTSDVDTSIARPKPEVHNTRNPLSSEQSEKPSEETASIAMPEREAQKSKPVAQQNPSKEAKPRRSKLRPRKAAMTISSSALEHLRELLEQDNKMIRVGVKNRGCSGLAYHLEYVEQPAKFDEVVEQEGVKVLIDSKALFSIIGSEMDWMEDKLSARFVFKNPNITEQCGCGESFSVS